MHGPPTLRQALVEQRTRLSQRQTEIDQEIAALEGRVGIFKPRSPRPAWYRPGHP